MDADKAKRSNSPKAFWYTAKTLLVQVERRYHIGHAKYNHMVIWVTVMVLVCHKKTEIRRE